MERIDIGPIGSNRTSFIFGNGRVAVVVNTTIDKKPVIGPNGEQFVAVFDVVDFSARMALPSVFKESAPILDSFEFKNDDELLAALARIAAMPKIENPGAHSEEYLKRTESAS